MAPHPPATARSILVVDDAPEVRTILARQLARAGIPTKTCATVEEALGALAEGDFCCAFVDVYFGAEPAGLRFLTAVRKDPRAADLPVVSMSGSGGLDLQRCIDLGADAVLAKPFTLQEVDQALGRAVAARGR